MNKVFDELVPFFEKIFTTPLFYIRKGENKFIVRGLKSSKDKPYIDDGSITGVKNGVINFFPFSSKKNDTQASKWIFDKYIEWLPGRSFEYGSDLDKRLRISRPYTFVLWIMRENSNIQVRDKDGQGICLPKEGMIQD